MLREQPAAGEEFCVAGLVVGKLRKNVKMLQIVSGNCLFSHRFSGRDVAEDIRLLYNVEVMVVEISGGVPVCVYLGARCFLYTLCGISSILIKGDFSVTF